MLTQWFTPLTLLQIERLLTLLRREQTARAVAARYGPLPSAASEEAFADQVLVTALTQARDAIRRHNARKGRFDAACKHS